MAMREMPSQNITAGFYNPGKKPLTTFFPPVKKPAAPPQLPVLNECEPTTPLTWNDYTGAVPAGANWGAMTASGIRLVNSFGQDWFQAFFDPAQSWVQPWNLTPGDNTVNGCQPTMTAMENFLRTHPGQSTHLNPPALRCAATILPAQVEVHNVGEVTSVFGAECSKAKTADSERLLKHERLHFDISCVLAKKANQLLMKGIDFNLVATGMSDLYRKINVDNGSGQGDYDQQTSHGCDQARQNDWETRVKNGLPDHRIPTVGDFVIKPPKNAG